MDAGILQLKLMADISDLVSKMGDAKREVNGSMDTMSNAFGLAKTAFVGLIGVGSVGAFAGMINSTLDAAGSLNDLSLSTGLSVESLSRFSEIGRTTGTSAEMVAGMMNKLSKSTADAKDGTSGAGAAITALGINFSDFQRLSPDEKLKTLAGAMNEVGMGSSKSASAMELMGKSGAQAIPFLTDLANAGDTVAKVTTAQAQAADNYSDNLTLLQTSGEEWKRELSLGMLPALNNATSGMVSLFNETGGLKEQISILAKDGSIERWTTTAITGVTYLMDAFSGVGAVVNTTGLFVGNSMAIIGDKVTSTFTAIKQAAQGDFSDAMKTIEDSGNRQSQMAKDLDADLEKTWGEQTLGAKLRERMADFKNTATEVNGTKVSANDLKDAQDRVNTSAKTLAEQQRQAAKDAKDAAKEIKAQQDAYDKLNGSIGEKTAAMQAELDGGVPLAEWQKAEVKLLAELESGARNMTDEQKLTTLQHIADMRAVEGKLEAYKLDKKASEDSAKANADMRDSLEKKTTALNDEAEKIRDHTRTLGLNATQLEDLIIQKGYDQAATFNQKAEWALQNDLGDDLVQQYKDQATALTTLADAKKEGIHVKAAVDAAVEWKKTTDSIASGLSGALTSAVLDGKDIWTTFRDFMVKTIIDGVLKKAIAGVITDAISGVNTSIGGMLSSMFSTAVGKTGGSAVAGGAGTSVAGSVAGSAGSSLLGSGSMSAGASMLGGSMSLANGFGSMAANATGTGLDGLLAMNGAYGTAGAAGSGAAGAGASGGIGGMGTLGTAAAAVAAMYVTKLALDQIMGFGGNNTVLDTRRVQGKGTWFDPNWGENGVLRDLSDVTVSKQVTTKGELLYEAIDNNSGWPVGPRGSLDEMSKFLGVPIPAFAMGGNFSGGARIVGERGPELELTGPSRIFDAATTASMLRSGGANDSEIVQELRAMRTQLAQLQQDARRTADATNGNPEAPMIVEIET